MVVNNLRYESMTVFVERERMGLAAFLGLVEEVRIFGGMSGKRSKKPLDWVVEVFRKSPRRDVLRSWVVQIHGGEMKKMKENQHSFSCRFPQTAPNVDAQNRRGLGTT
ncbi:hypothetical protein C1H46_004308 [Malus baccata]|uniref:Uncharacterized protein n=1 Tax=Malus baccata TaxID=106549 RepID=A0A540NG54_MALBA|nr:hypothetical protein C1H46_004308 [Malus baccata]